MKFEFFPLFYEIDLFENYLIFNNGKVFSRKTDKFLKTGINSHGYEFITLRNENVRCSISISRLVADYFVINDKNKEFVDHIDKNKLNNHYTNLRWTTRKENNLNKNKRKDNKSGFIGVSLDKKYHRWQADFCKDGIRIYKKFSFENNNEIDKETKFKEACEWRNNMTDENYDKKYFNGNL
jgi:hypothetical protein